MKNKLSDESMVYVGHIIETIELINEISKDMTQDNFESNITSRLALQKLVENIGEAFRHICKDDKTAKKTLEDGGVNVTGWVGIKNVLNHGYFKIDTDILWGTIAIDTKALEKEIAPFVQNSNQISSYLGGKECFKLQTSYEILSEIGSNKEVINKPLTNDGPEY